MTNYIKDISEYVYRPQNQVLSTIRSTLLNMLKELGIEGWNVAQANQPTIQELKNNTVYFDIISKRRYGTQSLKSIQDSTTGQWHEVNIWLEEWLVEISGFKQRRPDTDTILTLTASDVITKLQSCMNGGGKKTQGALLNPSWWPDWIHPIKSINLPERDYETDSGLKEKYPVFESILVIEQSILNTTPEIDKINLDIERI